jgi:flagellar biosynthesis protein FliQ|tara:strand:- start:126 stop:752 length:627 start_codon:yes stop_codon:yes gene_type:complete
VLEKIQTAIADDNELNSATLRVLSLVFLLISGCMSFFTYTKDTWLPWNNELSFAPGLIATIIALLLVAPLYLRGILKWNKSIYSIISFILILLVFASFTAFAMGGDDKKEIIQALLIVSVILSWLGVKGVAGISWILALSAAVLSAIWNSSTMGFYGFIYIGSGFMGLILHSGLNPGELMGELKTEYSSTSIKATNLIKDDIQTTFNK